jgi:serine protease Do
LNNFAAATALCVAAFGSAGAFAQVAANPVAADAKPATPPIIQQIVDRVKPSLVRIHVVEATPESGHEIKEESFGSGIVISADGYVVTNHHVAGNARWLSCTLSTREEVGAHLVGSDPLADIAVIKLDPSPSGVPYVAVPWGDSAKLHVGDPVLAMGSPLAFSQSVTSGIVSNTELILPAMMGDGMMMQGEDVGSIVRWIGHDAQIFPGNSGGPLISMAGEIVGINEIGVGLSGAIPSDIARTVAMQLITQKRVTRAYTGLDLQPALRGQKGPAGVLVGGILPNSPASAAGIEAGDILTQVGGEKVSARYPEEIPLINWRFTGLPIGSPTVVTLVRGGKTLTENLTPTLRSAAQIPSVEIKGWGVTATDMTPTEALELREKASARAVLITSTATGGAATDAQPPLKDGDLLLTIGGKPVSDVATMRAVTNAAVAAMTDDAGVPTLVEVRRQGERILTVVSLGKRSSEDTSDEIAKAWLPVEVQALTAPLATALHLPAGTHGVRVTEVVNDNPPATGPRLQVGDILTKLDGQEIEVSQPEEASAFFTLLRQYKIGAPVNVTGYRDSAPLTLTLKTVRAPREERELPHYVDPDFGLTLRSVTYKDRAEKEAGPRENGAMVLDVGKGSWAALAGMRAGDIIHRIDDAVIGDSDSAESALKLAVARHPRTVTFFVARGVHTLFIEAQTDFALSTPPVGLPRPASAHL